MPSFSSSSGDDSVVEYAEDPSVILVFVPVSLSANADAVAASARVVSPDLSLPEYVSDDREDADKVDTVDTVDAIDAGEVGDSEGTRLPLSDMDNCLDAGLEDLSEPIRARIRAISSRGGNLRALFILLGSYGPVATVT
ncbi:hypothetical protein MTO96_014892 [Rhipicephalus appendiculatus]